MLNVDVTASDNVALSSDARPSSSFRSLSEPKRSVTVQDMGAVTGWQTLASRVSQGQIYRSGTGDWQTKGAGPIALPDYCATAAK